MEHPSLCQPVTVNFANLGGGTGLAMLADHPIGDCVLRLTNVAEIRDTGVIKVEGRIEGDYVAELSRVTSLGLAQTERLQLDLAQVTFIDHAGVDLLRSLRHRGVQLIACPRFVSSLVNGGSE